MPLGDRGASAARSRGKLTYRAKLLATARQAYPDEIARPWALGFTYHPGVAVTFRVEEVFLQTPGPGAGTRMA